MVVYFPEAEKAQGAISVTVVPFASLSSTSAPSLAEILADGINVTMYLFAGSAMATATTTTGEAPRRLGSKDVLQEAGTTTHAIGDFQYVYSPQAADGDPVNAAKEMLTPGEEFWVIHRFGVDGEDELTATEKVDLRHVQALVQNKSMTGDGEFDQLSITQSVIAKAPPIEDVALVA